MGAVRQRVENAGWYFTSRAVRGAAHFASAAHLPLEPLYLDANIGAMGIAQADRSKPNAINHPGLAEDRAIGRELAKLAFGH